MAQPLLSVIVPTKNHQREILLTLLDIHRHLEQQPYASEIIVIDDASKDHTPDLVERYLPLIKNLKLIRNQRAQGQDFVTKQAMLVANGKWRALLSVTNDIPVIEFNKVLPYAQEGYEVFLSPRGEFQCFSAKAAEKIFTHAKRYRPRLVKKMGYKVKRVRVKRKRLSTPLAFMKRLWQNLKN